MAPSRRGFLGSAGALALPAAVRRRSARGHGPPSIAWSEGYGGPADDALRGALALESGYLLAGTYDPPGGARQDAWLLRIDDSGGVERERRYENPGYDDLRAVSAAGDGFAFVRSIPARAATGDRTELVRVAADGAVRWRRTYSAERDRDLDVEALAPRPGGGLLLAGRLDGSADEDAETGDEAGVAIAVDARGRERWRRTFGGDRPDRLSDAVALEDGYALVGRAESGSNGRSDAWFVRTDAKGRELHGTAHGGAGREELTTVTAVEPGYVLGGYTTSPPERGPLLLLVDRSGTAVWRRVYPALDGAVESLVVLEDGYLLGGGDTGGWLMRVDRWGRERWTLREFDAYARDVEAVLPAPEGALVAGTTRHEPGSGWQLWAAEVAMADRP